MFAPTPRAIVLMLLGVPVMVFIAVARPELWSLAGAWIFGLGGLMLADAALGARISRFEWHLEIPALLYIQSSEKLPVRVRFSGGPLPSSLLLRVETGALLEGLPTLRLTGWVDRTHETTLDLTPQRRGTARLSELWARWSGPLSLVRKRVRVPLDLDIPVTPNTRWVKEEAVRLYTRDAEFGMKAQIEKGEGSEFDALREFTTGMDRRAIDWKHSARHRLLLAKEFRTERNHNIVFAFDTGRLMSEPLGGVPKLDRAINAALLLAYVSLRSGDKARFYSFAARPGVGSGQLMGMRGYPVLQSVAAKMDYSSAESNFTLALSELSRQLDRRSLVILFTDFVDTISAELMLENVRRLTERHLVVFASFEDELLGRFVDAPPDTPQDVARAVIADNLLQERETVFLKLQRLGVQVIETRPERFGSELVSRYLRIKRREMI
ncbi:MAG: DUF58 domain-containing protein [Alphaproteobacteria bacterium]|jgi:uncharacterized protein (DUF58 family)|nr:DUF58 domain-containing protein [Alphaproteobacteria bacterium]